MAIDYKTRYGSQALSQALQSLDRLVDTTYTNYLEDKRGKEQKK